MAMQRWEPGFHPQDDCPLFKLPGEIRMLIFRYALQQCDDPEKSHDVDTCYRRPEHNSRRRTYTELLRTCKVVHSEAWFLPWTNSDHFVYLTAEDRKPPNTPTLSEWTKVLESVYNTYGEEPISHVYVYAQLYELEQSAMHPIINLKYFFPRTITLTIRHTDWWWWEDDEELHVQGHWVNKVKLPNTLRTFRICFESIHRKTDQIKSIAVQAKDKWFFRKLYGQVMSAVGSTSEVMRWTGSSTWHRRRWIRDETRPKELDYYCEIVSWTQDSSWPIDKKTPYPLELRGGQKSRIQHGLTRVMVHQLKRYGLEDASADQIRRVLENPDLRQMRNAPPL